MILIIISNCYKILLNSSMVIQYTDLKEDIVRDAQRGAAYEM